jgi:ribonuclease HI
MRVTIIADASHCSDTGASGYGYWIASERGKHGGGGSVRTKVSGSIAAEMIAIVNAIDVAVKRELLQKGDHALLQTDCQGAIDAFIGLRKRLTQHEKGAKEIFFELKRGAGFTFSFRHVKGHTSNTEARFVTNNLCDKRARKAMQLARRMLGETENV